MYANNISTVFTPEGKQKTFSLKVPPFFLRMAKIMSAQKCKCFLLKKNDSKTANKNSETNSNLVLESIRATMS